MPCSGGETEGDFGVNSPESEEWRTQLDVVGAAGIEAPGVATAFLAGGGGGARPVSDRGLPAVAGCGGGMVRRAGSAASWAAMS